MSNESNAAPVVEIVSGEGEQGTVETYTGKMTWRAINARLRRERCGGDRWAYVMIDGRSFNVRTPDDCRRLCAAWESARETIAEAEGKMNPDSPLVKTYEHAKHLVRLMENPQPLQFTWCEAVSETMANLYLYTAQWKNN